MKGLDKDTLDLLLKTIRDYAADRLPDEKLLQLDHDDEFPLDIVREMCGDQLGIQLIFIDEEYGGLGGGTLDVYRVCETMGYIDVGVATGVLATFLGSDPIMFGGTPEQKQHWLGRLAEEGLLMAYGATEPDAGSDLGSLRTTATPVEEKGEVVGYEISGNKQWISNGGFADLYTILARTPGGPSWFIVERDADGFSYGKPEDKHGIRASNTAPLMLQDVYVDADRLVGGEEGQGLQQAQNVFGYTRLMVAAFGLGAGWAALDRAIEYSTERVQAGSPLSEKQGYTHKLIVPHAVQLEAARSYIEESAERLDRGEHMLNTEGAIAKYMATEAGNAAAEAAIQALGGYGYVKEYMVEKIKRDVRITTIYEGTSEIMEMTISRDRWRSHLMTRGQHYHDEAATLEQAHSAHPSVGAGTAALAYHALAEVLEQARLRRLTRNQHVQFRLGELIAYGECAAAFVRRAVRALDGRQSDKADTRFSPDALAAMSRVFARTAAMTIAEEGLRWINAAEALTDQELTTFEADLGLRHIHQAQANLIADMDAVADALYDRT
ncbi:MAG: acyl-CoA dehydrogenase [Bacteroidetes bacterium]|nr:acyl-CoA dehydrogenase [Bacteroidota bacterium]